MEIFGYAHGASQKAVESQVELLLAEGIDEGLVFRDSRLKNDGMSALKKQVQQGDTVLLTSLDRLGSDTPEMIGLIEGFNALGVTLKFIEDGFSIDGSADSPAIKIIKATCKVEKQRVIERTQHGRSKAKAKGVKFGRKRFIDRHRVEILEENNYSVSDISRILGIGRSTVYKLRKEKRAPNPGDKAIHTTLNVQLTLQRYHKGVRTMKRTRALIEKLYFELNQMKALNKERTQYEITINHDTEEELDTFLGEAIHEMHTLAQDNHCLIEVIFKDKATKRVWDQ